MTKIVVPEGMLKAAMEIPRVNGYCTCDTCNDDRARMLEAALSWWSEHPIVPTFAQMRDVEMAAAHEPLNSTQWLSDALTEWQRRMFLAPEPEPKVPEEIKDLLTVTHEAKRGITWTNEGHDLAVIEAYRRGQKAGSK